MKKAAQNSLCILLVCAVCSNGCVALWVGAGAGAAAGTYAYVKGQLEATYSAEYEQTWAATLDTLEALEISVEEKNKDAFGGNIKARRADGTPVRIEVAPVTSDVTSVKIRVGVFGDRAISERIRTEIEGRLS